jgi:hypothetical protein
VSIFFNSPCLFCKDNWRERSTYILEHLFREMEGWTGGMFANSQRRSLAYVGGLYVFLIMKAWNECHRSPNGLKAQCKN